MELALLRQSRRAGVYHLPPRRESALRAAAADAEFAWREVPLAGVHDKAGFLHTVAQALSFPGWFGHNWDALEDCLTDLSWIEAEGFVVVLRAADEMNGAAEQDLLEALRVFNAAAEAWREEGIAFWTFVELGADGIAFLPELT